LLPWPAATNGGARQTSVPAKAALSTRDVVLRARIADGLLGPDHRAITSNH